jgi:DNA-directed RNA polymerase specialized sigma24 family protein
MKKEPSKPKVNHFKRKKKIKKIEDYEDLVFHDVLDHEEEHHEDDDALLHLEEEVDLVEEALKEEDEPIKIEEIEELIIEEKPKKRGKKADKTKFYVDPKEFDDEIVKYYDTDKMSDKLADMISKISHKLSFAPNFINYSFREELVGDGVIRMMKALMSKKYNRDKGTNPFSYFTRIAFNAFRNRIKKEKHVYETRQKYQEEIMLMSTNYNTLCKNNNIKIDRSRDI